MKKLLIILLLAVFVVACKTTEQVITNTTSSNSVSENNHASIERVHDTTYIEKVHYITIKPDTVIIRDSVTIHKYRDRFLNDTVEVILKDTFTNVVTETVEKIKVEKVPTPANKFLVGCTIAFWIILVIVVIVIIWKIAKGKIPIINKIKNLFIR